MKSDEREEYGKEAQEVIKGLRRLGESIETPPDLLPHLLARGEQLLPPRQRLRTRWRKIVVAWLSRPAVWGPALAVTCFLAGVFVPSPPFGTPKQSTVSVTPETVLEKRSTLPLPSLSRDETESPQPVPVAPKPLKTETPPALSTAQEEQKTQTLRELSASPAQRTVEAPRTFSAVQGQRRQEVAPQKEAADMVPVTTTLPAALYEQLRAQAQQRQVDPSTLLREAVEKYIQESKRGE
jgi:hypothetical protein